MAFSIEKNLLGLYLFVVAVLLAVVVVALTRLEVFHDDLLHGDDADGAQDDLRDGNLKKLLLFLSNYI